MKPIVPLLLTAMALLAAEDPWVQVRELKSGTELRIYKVNTKEPFLAKFDRASEESLIVVTKTGQVSIPKEQIERLDCRRTPPPQIVKDTRLDRKIASKGPSITNGTLPGVTTSVKTRLDIPSKSAFEKIYDRTPEGK
jgi:hypothetical protein